MPVAVVLAAAGIVASVELRPTFDTVGDEVGVPLARDMTVTVVDDDQAVTMPIAAHIVSITQPELPPGVTERFAIGDDTVPNGAGEGDGTATHAGHVRPVAGTRLHAHARTTVLWVITVSEPGTYQLGPTRLAWQAGLLHGSVLIGSSVTIRPPV